MIKMIKIKMQRLVKEMIKRGTAEQDQRGRHDGVARCESRGVGGNGLTPSWRSLALRVGLGLLVFAFFVLGGFMTTQLGLRRPSGSVNVPVRVDFGGRRDVLVEGERVQSGQDAAGRTVDAALARASPSTTDSTFWPRANQNFGRATLERAISFSMTVGDTGIPGSMNKQPPCRQQVQLLAWSRLGSPCVAEQLARAVVGEERAQWARRRRLARRP